MHSSLQSCYELRLSHDNKHMVTGGADSLVTMWEMDCLTCLYTYDECVWEMTMFAHVFKPFPVYQQRYAPCPGRTMTRWSPP